MVDRPCTCFVGDNGSTRDMHIYHPLGQIAPERHYWVAGFYGCNGETDFVSRFGAKEITNVLVHTQASAHRSAGVL